MIDADRYVALAAYQLPDIYIRFVRSALDHLASGHWSRQSCNHLDPILQPALARKIKGQCTTLYTYQYLQSLYTLGLKQYGIVM